MKSVKIFSTVEPYELLKVMDAVKPAEFKAGAEIIRQVPTLAICRGTKDMSSIYWSVVKPTP